MSGAAGFGARATGIGSMPGEDVAEAVRVVTGDLPDLPHLPELPGRGPHASMSGRTTALLVGLAADLQPAGWRLSDASGVDHRRAVSLLAQDLDALEEFTQGYAGPLKVQVSGPWTLAATVERPRGDRVLADHGARRELAQSLAEGIAEHVVDLARRVPAADIVVQVDEPALPAVLAAAVPTASGFGRHRSVDAPAATATLQQVTAAISGAGARPVVHVCAADVPVSLLVDAGFTAISYDLALARPDDVWGQALDAGVDLWPGVVLTTPPEGGLTDAELTDRLLRFFDRLGHDAPALASRIVVTPACGLAGASPDWTREALRLATRVAAAVTG